MMATTHMEEDFGVWYKYQIIKGKRHLVFKCKTDFEDYFMGLCGAIPRLVDNWRDSKEGDWVIADDGGVVEVLRTGDMKHPQDKYSKKWSKGYVRTIVGSFVNRENISMDTDFSQHPNRYLFSKKLQNPLDNFYTREKLTKNEIAFAILVSIGEDVGKAYRFAFNYTGSSNRAVEKGKMLMITRRVIEMARSDLSNAAKEAGVTPEWIITSYKNIAETSKSDNAKLEAIGKLQTIIEDSQDSPSFFGDGLSGFDESSLVTGGRVPVALLNENVE